MTLSAAIAVCRNALRLRGCPDQQHSWVSDRLADRWRLRCLECGGTTTGVVVAVGNLDRQVPAVIERAPLSAREQHWQARQFKSRLRRRRAEM